VGKWGGGGGAAPGPPPPPPLPHAFFLCLIALLITSCNIFNNNQPVKMVKAPLNKQTYTVAEVGITDFTTLDPALAQDNASINAIQMIFTGLVQLNDKLQVYPQLASSWDESQDGLTWTFHLRPHLAFSDGTELTSTDVAYSIDRALQPATQSMVAPIYLGLIKDADKLLAGKISTLIGDSILTPDPSTLVIKTKKRAAYFLAMLTSPCSYVVERSLIDKYGSDKWTDHLSEGGGAGPFKVAQYAHRQAITFVPDPHYYQAKPQLQKVTFAFYSSANEAYQAYQSGRVDMTGIPLSAYSSVNKRSDFFQVPQLWINYYTMNYLVKPFDNIHIRQAFALAVDKVALARNVWKGTVLPTNHIVPQGMPGYNPQLTGPDGARSLQGDPARAQALLRQGLQEEGWTSVAQLPAITLTYAANVPNLTQEVAALTGMWQKVLHITVKTDAVDYNTLLDKVTAATNNAQGLQFWGLAWIAEYPDPQDWLTRQFDSGSPNNNMNYGQNTSSDAAQQQATQQALEAADTNPQERARMQSYQQAEQQLVNDVAWLPVEQETATFLRSPSITGINDNGMGLIPPNDWAAIYRVQPAPS
jgi:oligopeptide transport system substrate-binding protein